MPPTETEDQIKYNAAMNAIIEVHDLKLPNATVRNMLRDLKRELEDLIEDLI